ncbi:MAG TPA: tetratricopeptide repeat protein [Chthonomonadaceae bacterium]|nr:tetratricopeptide repeat protein [Chthonomonadaceae bacterium]
MSVERDAGVAAFEQGDIANAITQLEAATRQDPKDFQAHLYLGAAYGQAERHMDAVNTLTQAVTIEPANAKARYNLGVAMEKAGYKEQAIAVLQQALLLQPDYTKAQEALQRLTGAPAAGQQPGAAPYAAQTPGYGQPTQPAQPYPGAQNPPAGTGSPLPTNRPWPTQPTQNAPYPGQQAYGQQPTPQQPPAQAGGLGSYQSAQQQPYQQQGAASYGGPPVNAYNPTPGRPYAPIGMLSEPKEANESLIYGIISLFCCGIILGIVAIVKANTAKQIIAANPGMQGGGKATAGMVLGIIGMGLSVLLIIVRLIALSSAMPH